MFYSVWFEYVATGEGGTIGLMYCQASNESEAINIAKREFGSWFGNFCETEPSIKTDGFFKSLAPTWVSDNFKKMESGEAMAGLAIWHSVYHVNYS